MYVHMWGCFNGDSFLVDIQKVLSNKNNLIALLVGGGFVFHTESEYICEEVRSKQAFHYD